jgi:hypothetical protein
MVIGDWLTIGYWSLAIAIEKNAIVARLAIADCARAAEKSPADPRSRLTIGRAYHVLLGRYDT